jgi:hypothetical protein
MTVGCSLILNPDFSMKFQRRLILNLEPAIPVLLPVDLESEIEI